MNIDITPIEADLKKIKKKDPKQFEAITKKIIQISQNDMNSLNHFKNLKGEQSNYKRVHIGSFVLIFRIENETIIFKEFSHHDDAYNT